MRNVHKAKNLRISIVPVVFQIFPFSLRLQGTERASKQASQPASQPASKQASKQASKRNKAKQNKALQAKQGKASKRPQPRTSKTSIKKYLQFPIAFVELLFLRFTIEGARNQPEKHTRQLLITVPMAMPIHIHVPFPTPTAIASPFAVLLYYC